MQVQFHDEAAALLVAADPFFRADPFSANVIAGVAGRVAAGTRSDGDRPVWATIENEHGTVIGVAMRTPPHPLFVSRMPGEAAVALANALSVGERELPGVNGASEATAAFAETWAQLTGRAATRITAMRMYRLEALQSPDPVPGAGRQAHGPEDAELVAVWFAAFHDEAQPHAPDLDWTTLARQRVAEGEIQLWCDDAGTPVSLAALAGPSAGVARVGPVYTPPAARRQGYGAAVTAEATAAAIATGAEHVVLYTDLANPTSNSIYQALGYRPEHDAEELLFG